MTQNRTGQRREERTRRMIGVGVAVAVLPSVMPAAAAIVGGSRSWIVGASTAASFVSAVVVALLLSGLVRRLADQQARFDTARHQWRDEALTDPLCAVANRRGAVHELERRRATATEDDVLTVVAIDIDRFKQVNDRHGHAAGDRVLVAVASVLAERAPAGSIVARWGGDEFAVFHVGGRGRPQGPGADWADGLAAAIAACSIPCRDGAIGVTVSFGVAVGAVADDEEQLLAVADERLLEAKVGWPQRYLVDAG